jgi:hypothetical protein
MWLNCGNHKVFYRCRRVNGTPQQILVGTGPLAEKLAAEREVRKAARKAAAEELATWVAQMRAVEEPLDALCAGLDQVVTASLLMLGYHRHDRSKWRKGREYRKVPGV